MKLFTEAASMQVPYIMSVPTPNSDPPASNCTSSTVIDCPYEKKSLRIYETVLSREKEGKGKLIVYNTMVQ